MPTNVVIVGAGVSGLTTALLLSKHGHLSITIVAKHMPGDIDIEYASPWAGANFFAFSRPGTDARQYEKNTWPELARLAAEVPEAGIHFQDVRTYRRAKDVGTPAAEIFEEILREDPWFKDLLPNFRVLQESELPSGTDGGTSFTSVCINTALYLPWLLSQCLKRKVNVRCAVLDHIKDASSLHHSGRPADVIINCTGLSSYRLGGVQDQTMYPIRGQTVLVRNSPGAMYCTSGTDDSADEVMYIMERAGGGGTILGGCMQVGNWESQPDPNLAVRIMTRCVQTCPALVQEGQGIEGLSVVRHGVGLRPGRRDGVRIEKESIQGKHGEKTVLVHNYGHAGYGYQTSYACSRAVEKLVLDSLRDKARL